MGCCVRLVTWGVVDFEVVTVGMLGSLSLAWVWVAVAVASFDLRGRAGPDAWVRGGSCGRFGGGAVGGSSV